MSEPKRTVTFIFVAQEKAVIEVPEGYSKDASQWTPAQLYMLKEQAYEAMEGVEAAWLLYPLPDNLDEN